MEGSGSSSRPDNDGNPVLTPSFSAAQNNKPAYFLYCIWDRSEDRYYVGISRNPETRILKNLNNKNGLKEVYLRTRLEDSDKPMQDRTIQQWIIGRPRPATSNSYSNILIGCVSEVLHMLHLEEAQGKVLFNENYFGGHSDLRERRPAFNAIVKILKPSLSGRPTDDEMKCLSNYIHEIKRFTKDTENKELLNEAVVDKIHMAYKDYLTHKGDKFGHDRSEITTLGGHPLIPVAERHAMPKNDNHIKDEIIPRVA